MPRTTGAAATRRIAIATTVRRMYLCENHVLVTAFRPLQPDTTAARSKGQRAGRALIHFCSASAAESIGLDIEPHRSGLGLEYDWDYISEHAPAEARAGV